MSESSSSTKSCPYGLDNVNIKNILLIILTLKTLWNTFKNSGPEVNLEELITSRMGEQLIHIPAPIPTPITQQSINFSLTKLILLLFFVYFIFYVKDLLDSLNCKLDCEMYPDEGCGTKKCPFGFEKKI